MASSFILKIKHLFLQASPQDTRSSCQTCIQVRFAACTWDKNTWIMLLRLLRADEFHGQWVVRHGPQLWSKSKLLVRAAMLLAKQSLQRSSNVLLPCTQDYRLGPFPTTKVAEWVDGCETCSDKASYWGPAPSQSLLTQFLAILHFGHPRFFTLSFEAPLANHLLQIIKSSEPKACLFL